jgi:hypothetical protein
MKACANEDSKEFKNLLKLVNGEKEVARDIWFSLEGEVDHITTKELAEEAYFNIVEESVENVTVDDAALSIPLSKFSPQEIDELVDSLLFMVAWDSENERVLDADDVTFKGIRKTIEGFRDDPAIADDEFYQSNYEEILKDENLDALVRKADAKLVRLGFTQEREQDADSKTEGISITPSYLIANKDKARVNAKLLVAFLPEKGKNKLLGVEGFVDSASTWYDIEQVLSNTSFDSSNPDKLEAFYEILQREESVKPVYKDLVEALKKATPFQRTQFYRAMDNYKIPFMSEIIEEVNMGTNGYKTDHIDSDSVSNTKRLLRAWSINYREALMTVDEDGKPIAKTDSDGNTVAAGVLEDYRLLVDDVETAEEMSDELLTRTSDLLSKVGIHVNHRALEVFIANSGEKPLDALDDLLSVNNMGYIFNSTRANVDSNTVQQLADGKGVKSNEYKELVTPVVDEQNLTALADIQERFEINLSSNGVLGPDGKMYQTISQWDQITSSAVEIANNTDYLERTSDSFTGNSIYREYLSDPENAKNFKINMFLSRRYRGHDAGVDINGTSYADEYASRIENVLNGKVPYLTLADKNRMYYMEGIPNDVDKLRNTTKLPDSIVRRFMGYFADEIISMQNDWEHVVGQDSAPIEWLVENAHAVTKGKNRYIFNEEVDGKLINSSLPEGALLGKRFTSTLFPELSPVAQAEIKKQLDNPDLDEETRTELESKFFDLYDTTNNNRPYTLAPSFLGENIEGETTAEKGFRRKVFTYIKNNLNDRINESAAEMRESLVEVENGQIKHFALSDTTRAHFIDNNLTKGRTEMQALRAGLRGIALNYTVATLTANIEATKLFTGDPRMYKSLEDFAKRIPAGSATGDYLRIRKPGENNELEGANPTFDVAVAPNFYKQSEFLSNKAEIDRIKKAITKEVPKGKERNALNRLVDVAAESYSSVNRTDAQAWITMDRFREIMIGLGDWNSSMEDAFGRIMDPNKNGKATAKDLDLFTKKMTTMQPKKGQHFELVNDGYGNIVPVYLKYSQAVLFPQLIASSPILSDIAEQMKAQGVSELITGDGVKVGAIGQTEITEVDNTGGLARKTDIEFNTITLSNNNWKLQQDLPAKDKPTLVGSQIKVNILADINPDGMYSGMKGSDLIQALHSMDGELSNRGLETLQKKLGMTNGKIEDPTKLYEELARELTEEGESEDVINALKKEKPLDFIFSRRSMLYNKVSAMFNKHAVKIKQAGGSSIQISDFGFDDSAQYKFKSFEEAKDPDKKGIVWLKDEKKLDPIRVVESTVEGETVYEVKGGEVLLPYESIAKAFGPDWDRIKKLPPSEILELIDEDVLNLTSYRIPGQKISFIDPIKVVGILPPQIGNSIIMYSEITTKTGSDFDIDKSFFIKRPLDNTSYKNNGKLSTHKFMDESTTVEDRYEKYVSVTGTEPTLEEFKEWSITKQNTTKALESYRVDLYEKVLLSPRTFARVVAPVDNEYLPEQINYMLPKAKLKNLEMFTGEYQTKLRREFIASKGGVGQIANQQGDHAISQWGLKSINDPSGRISSDGIIDLSRTFSKEFEVLAKDKDGNLNGKIAEVIKDEFFITEVISTYMNAFVDAAKDNYIGRANYNHMTNNTAFMLLRSGVSPQKVNAFMSQPLIREFVELTSLREGQAVPFSQDKPRKLLEKKYNIKDVSDDITVDDLNTVSLMENVRMDKDILNMREQFELLDLFLHVRDVSKVMSATIQASKAPVNGGGTNIMEAYVQSNMKKNVGNLVDKNGTKRVNNWDRMFEGTMLGHYHSNSIGGEEGQGGIIGAAGHLFLAGTDAMQQALNAIYLETYGKFPDDLKKYNKLYQLGIATYLADNSGLTMSAAGIESLFKGKNSIARRVQNMKNHPENKYKNNTLIQLLLPSLGIYSDLDYVSLNNSKGMDSVTSESATAYWELMFRDPDTRTFAIDLAKYAFFSSGFSDNLSTMYRLMPDILGDELGFTKENFDIYRTELNTLSEEEFKGMIKPIIFRNSWKDTSLIPRISKQGSIKLTKGDTRANVMGVNYVSSPHAVAGHSKDGDPVYKPYITRNFKEGLRTVTHLYEYIGNIDKESEAGNMVTTGVYKRATKLGETKGIHKFLEFPHAANIKSVINDNNVVFGADTKKIIADIEAKMLKNNEETGRPIIPTIDTMGQKNYDSTLESEEIFLALQEAEKEMTPEELEEAKKKSEELTKTCKNKNK